MHKLNELAARLSAGQLKEVEDFAEFLLSRREASAVERKSKYLDVDSFAGMFEGLAPERTAVELVHEANEAMASKYDRLGK